MSSTESHGTVESCQCGLATLEIKILSRILVGKGKIFFWEAAEMKTERWSSTQINKNGSYVCLSTELVFGFDYCKSVLMNK